MSRHLPLRKLTARALAVSVFAVGALLLSVAPSGAQEAELPLVGEQAKGKDPKPLESGDERAIARPKNVTKCEQVDELKDAADVTEDLEVTIDETNTYITIDEIPEGIELTGVVVKGSDGYNLYLPENLDENGWVRLHSPIAGGSEKPANISHWFACGKETDTEEPTSSSSSSSSTTTSSSTGGGNGGSGGDDDLANTGAPAGQLLLTAGALLALGAGLVLAARRRAFGRS